MNRNRVKKILRDKILETLPYQAGTQKWYIVKHLLLRGSITQVEAETVYKIRRLSSRISEIRKEVSYFRPAGAFPIEVELKKDLLQQRYAKYYIPSPVYKPRS